MQLCDTYHLIYRFIQWIANLWTRKRYKENAKINTLNMKICVLVWYVLVWYFIWENNIHVHWQVIVLSSETWSLFCKANHSVKLKQWEIIMFLHHSTGFFFCKIGNKIVFITFQLIRFKEQNRTKQNGMPFARYTR